MLSKGVYLLLTVAILVIETEAYRSWRDRRQCYPKCERGCQKVPTEGGCYKCECEPACSEPKCKEGCTIDKLPGEPCPSCVCKEEEVPKIDWRESWERCHPKCEKGCQKVRTEKRCYKCECEPACSEPKCKEGCTIEKFPGEPCPSCVCKEEDIPVLDWRAVRAECYPKCERKCRKVRTEKGCHKCVCEPACSEPKCKEGCTIEKLPGEPCPSCVCKEEEVPVLDLGEGREKCYPKCERSCRKIYTEKGCYKCDCKPACSAPKCGEGCSLEKLPGEPCPSCVCKEEEIPALDIKPQKICEPVKCDPWCVVVDNGKEECPECMCPLCARPKCEPGCFIPTEFEGECPQCKCKEEMPPKKIVCDPPKCKPGCKIQTLFEGPCPGCECEEEVKKCPILEPCAKDPSCKFEIDENGCDVCICKPKCEIPKCNRRCRVKEIEGGCPICDCTRRHK